MAVDSPRSDGSVIFRQHRGKQFLIACGALAFVVAGFVFVLHPEQWRDYRHSTNFNSALGWITVIFFSIALFGSAVALAKPTTVCFAPNGLVVSSVWRTYARPWSALSNFRIWQGRSTRMVVFDDETPSLAWLGRISQTILGATSALPTLLNARPEEVLEAAMRAKERWG